MLRKDYVQVRGGEGMNPLWKQQLAGLAEKGKHYLDRWWLQNKDKYQRLLAKPGVVPGVLSVLCLSAALQLTDQWQVVVDDEVVGVTEDRQAIVGYLQELDDCNRKEYESAEMINDLKLARSFGIPAVKIEDMQLILQDKLEWGIPGAVIAIDNRDVLAFKDLSSAQAVVANIKQKTTERLANLYKTFNVTALNIRENLQVIEKPVAIASLVDEATAETFLLSGQRKEVRHIVSRGETFTRIAASRGIRPSELAEANPGVKATQLQIGQELAVTVPDPLIHVEATAEVTETKTVPFETEYVKDSSLYKGEKKTVTKGQNGIDEVTSVLTLVNGQTVGSEVKTTTRVKEPVTAVVKQGTKVAVVTGSGRFVWPTQGSITSPYGMRWGKMHYGLDIGASRGTAIVAADSGVVVYSGRRGNYGYMVEINHGNGYVTRYGHCSQLLVSKGAKVSRGQLIAKVGSTGYSFGNHLHFEVLYQGVNKNPINFLR